MRRKALFIAAMVSLALCVALAGLQVYVHVTNSRLLTPWGTREMMAWKGGLLMAWWTDAPGASSSSRSWQALGFFWQSTTLAANKNIRVAGTISKVGLPYWFLYTLLLVAPGGWAWGRYRRRRQGRGFPVILAGEGERQPNG